jgi:predicted ATPase
VYRSYGYDLVDVPAASVAERAELVQSVIDGIRGHRRS